jgi:cell division protein FtsW (lipid II flippase)
MRYNVIGGADGPTSIFLAGKTGPDWINLFGLFVVLLLLIPNVIYAFKFRDRENKCKNKGMNILEQTGRYASMFLMVFNIGIAEFGFSSVGAFLLYGFGNTCLLLAYWIVWMFYFHKQDFGKAMVLAVLPVCMFVLSGVTLGHVLLIISGVVFGIAHIYVTYQNAKERSIFRQ